MQTAQPENARLLRDWEEVFRRGLLTFWTFVAIAEEPADVETVRTRIAAFTRGAWLPTEQTLYRQFRRHLDLGLVSQTHRSSRLGPPKKIYTLSGNGRDVLHQFARRNIEPFEHSSVRALIKGEEA